MCLFPIEEKYFQKRQKQKKVVFFYSFKTLPINKLKKIYHILKNTFLSFPFMPLRVTSYPEPVMYMVC